jgi:hypothetical protein
MKLTLVLRWSHRRQVSYLTGRSCLSGRSIELLAKTERREPEVFQVGVRTGLTLRGIVAFNHNVNGIVERKNVFGFVPMKNEGLRA